MSLSNYFENKLIDFIFRGVSYTPPTTLYFALCTALPTDADTGETIQEVSGGNYSRKAIVSNSDHWFATQGGTAENSDGTSGQTGNVNTLSWNSTTWANNVVAMAICDAITNGNLIYFQAFDSPQSFGSGSTLNFASNSIKISFN